MAEKMLTPEEVAERLAVTPNTVRGWLRVGTLKGVKLGKRVWRISEASVNAHLCREKIAAYETEEKDQVGMFQQLIEDLAELNQNNIDKVHSFVLKLKEEEYADSAISRGKSYLKARRALSQYEGSLSKIIDQEREERL